MTKPDTILTDISDISLPPMPEEGLHWHALNYRTAHTLHAQIAWGKLDEFVQAYARAAVLMDREKLAMAFLEFTQRDWESEQVAAFIRGGEDAVTAWNVAMKAKSIALHTAIRQGTESKQEQDEKAAVHRGIKGQ